MPTKVFRVAVVLACLSLSASSGSRATLAQPPSPSPSSLENAIRERARQDAQNRGQLASAQDLDLLFGREAAAQGVSLREVVGIYEDEFRRSKPKPPWYEPLKPSAGWIIAALLFFLLILQDAVRKKLDPETLEIYKRDKRLNHETLQKGINPTNVWKIPRLNGNSKERVGHPTQKPKALIDRIMRSLSYPGSTVLDFFAGSGVTTRVAVEVNRHSISADIDKEFPAYVSRHLTQVQGDDLLSPQANYRLLTDGDWSEHPVFSR